MNYLKFINMKTKLLLSAILFIAMLSVITTSCSKASIATPSLIGLWHGAYANGTDLPTDTGNLGYSFLFRSNGTVRVFDRYDTIPSEAAEGTYTVSGDTVSTTYTFTSALLTYSSTAVINSSDNFMFGTWGSGSNTSGSGLFYISK